MEVRKHIEHFARASDRYVLVWDRTGADTLARQEEARARAVARAREEQRYQQAETVILDYLNTRPPFEASEAALRRRPRCYPKKLRVPKRVLCALSQTRKSAWAMVPFPNRLFLSSSFQEPALPPRDSYDGDSLSPALQQALGLWLPHQVLHVEARNEADNTISRIARGSYNDYAIVILSTDTDYLVRDSVQHVGWTLSKLGQGRRWRLTDRSKLQAIAPALFQDLDRARMAALIAGQDYTSVGIKGVSWTALADLADCLSVSRQRSWLVCEARTHADVPLVCVSLILQRPSKLSALSPPIRASTDCSTTLQTSSRVPSREWQYGAHANIFPLRPFQEQHKSYKSTILRHRPPRPLQLIITVVLSSLSHTWSGKFQKLDQRSHPRR